MPGAAQEFEDGYNVVTPRGGLNGAGVDMRGGRTRGAALSVEDQAGLAPLLAIGLKPPLAFPPPEGKSVVEGSIASPPVHGRLVAATLALPSGVVSTNSPRRREHGSPLLGLSPSLSRPRRRDQQGAPMQYHPRQRV